MRAVRVVGVGGMLLALCDHKFERLSSSDEIIKGYRGERSPTITTFATIKYHVPTPEQLQEVTCASSSQEV